VRISDSAPQVEASAGAGRYGKVSGVHPTSLADLWDRVYGPQPDPPTLLILGTALLALAVVATYRVWQVARHVVTIAHEGGHALAALLTGRRLSAIRLHSDTSGLTVSSGRSTGPGMVVTSMAGYVTPSLLGLVGAAALAAGRITLLLWTALVLLPLMLIMIRNVFGVVSIVVTTGAIFAVSWFASTEVQAAFAYLSVWFLLVGGVRPVFELQRMRRRRQLPDSDADQLARLTRLPGLVWVGFFGVVNVAALTVGGALMLNDVPLDLTSLTALT
jgi:hypothetical protein